MHLGTFIVVCFMTLQIFVLLFVLIFVLFFCVVFCLCCFVWCVQPTRLLTRVGLLCSSRFETERLVLYTGTDFLSSVCCTQGIGLGEPRRFHGFVGESAFVSSQESQGRWNRLS